MFLHQIVYYILSLPAALSLVIRSLFFSLIIAALILLQNLSPARWNWQAHYARGGEDGLEMLDLGGREVR